MNKEELQNKLKEKSEELKALSTKMGKAFNACDKNDQLLKECNSTLRLTKYAVAILTLVSATIFVSIINSFNIVFLLLNVLLIFGDVFSIIKLKKINRQFKKLNKEKIELTEVAGDYYKQVSSLKTNIKEIKNKLESCATNQAGTNNQNKEPTVSSSISDTIHP